MSGIVSQDPVQSSSTAAKKKNKKKKNAGKAKELLSVETSNGAADNDVASDEAVTPASATPVEAQKPELAEEEEPAVNGHADSEPTNGLATARTLATETEPSSAADSTTARLDAMSQEREALKAEVEQLRKQLEEIRESHVQEVTQLRSDLEESENAKDLAQTQYQNLLGRVEKIKETLGDRLKRDKQELEEAKDRIEELEAHNDELQKGASAYEEEVDKLKSELAESTREVTSLRSRGSLSQQNWQREKEELARQVSHLKAEVDSTNSAMGEWEVIAMEERSVRESLADKAADLEDQLAALRDAHDRAARERDTQEQAVDGLQRALAEIQDARRRELRQMVEVSEEQAARLKELTGQAESRAVEAEAARESLARELERTAPFEKEVKEKNLLLGKLRHETIVLNDHLTKALRHIMKSKAEDNVDRQIVTNYLLQFLALERSDPKKFQILQVIANYLNWTDEQKEQAGLARPGASAGVLPASSASSTLSSAVGHHHGGGGSLRLPLSPFHRTPSTPSLASIGTDFFNEPTPTSATSAGSAAGGKESLADMWASFLERSVEESSSVQAADARSRKDSASSTATAGRPAKP